MSGAGQCWRKPRDGGSDLHAVPSFGSEIAASNPADQVAYNKARAAGVVAWNNIAARMASVFPGKVMYLPLADSILLNGKFSSWLPPLGGFEMHRKSQWIRVRKVDNVHICPEGSARYALALLT